MDAEKELKQPLGWEWHELFTDVAGKLPKPKPKKTAPSPTNPSPPKNPAATHHRCRLDRSGTNWQRGRCIAQVYIPRWRVVSLLVFMPRIWSSRSHVTRTKPKLSPEQHRIYCR